MSSAMMNKKLGDDSAAVDSVIPLVQNNTPKTVAIKWRRIKLSFVDRIALHPRITPLVMRPISRI